MDLLLLLLFYYIILLYYFGKIKSKKNMNLSSTTLSYTVVETETAVILTVFSTWTYQNIHTTHLVIEGGTLKPTHLSKGIINIME